MRRIVWLVLVCLIGLGAVVAIKIGATRTPEGADVDKARVGAATEQGIPIRAKNVIVYDPAYVREKSSLFAIETGIVALYEGLGSPEGLGSQRL